MATPVTLRRISFKRDFLSVRDLVRDFEDRIRENNPAKIMYDSADDFRTYWKSNVYNHMNKRISMGLPVSGELGRALRIKYDPSKMTISFSIAPISRGSTGISGGATDNYIPYLKKGIPPDNSGMYLRRLDRRIKKGGHPGISGEPFNAFLSDFKQYIKRKEMGAINTWRERMQRK